MVIEEEAAGMQIQRTALVHRRTTRRQRMNPESSLSLRYVCSLPLTKKAFLFA
jgi:hypothetical protein